MRVYDLFKIQSLVTLLCIIQYQQLTWQAVVIIYDFFFLLAYYGYMGLIHFHNTKNTTRGLIGQNSMCYWAGKLIENCCNKCMNICKKNHDTRKYPLNGNRQFYCCLPGLWMKVRLELTLF